MTPHSLIPQLRGLAGLVGVTFAVTACSAAATEPAAPRPTLAATPTEGPRQDRFDRATLPPIGADLDFGGVTEPIAARLHLIDVGQGAATLLELSCAAVLVDTGGEASRDFSGREAVGAYLEAFFDRRPDLARTIRLLVVTHPHVDHTRNVKMLVESYAIDNVVTDGRTSGSGGSQQKWLQRWAAEHVAFEAIESESIPAGGKTSRVIDPVRCKDWDPELHALWGSIGKRPDGWTKEAFEDENNHSVVIRADVGRASFLVSGDLETEGMAAVIDKHRGTRALDVDVLEIGHHGSENGTSRAWLDATTPSIALAAVGPMRREAMWTAWAYGHPRASVVELLRASPLMPRPPVDVWVATAPETFRRTSMDRAVYATGWDGDVVVTASATGRLRVQTAR